MRVLTLDFETYYDREYSLRNMTTIEYIKDPRFEAIMMSYALDSEPVQNLLGKQAIQRFLDSLDWNNIIVNAQNTQFDGTILRERFGKTAKFYADTMAMARVTGAHIFEGASLRAISNVLRKVGYPVPPKGTEVESAQGKHLQFYASEYDHKYYLAEEQTDEYADVVRGETLLNAYVQYCNNDVELARQAFLYFSSMISPDEMKYGDMILKTYIVPSTYLDLNIINTEIARIEQRDKERAQGIADKYFNGDMTQLRATCRSAKLFTEFLRLQGGVLASEVGMQPEEIIEGGYGRFIIPERHSEKKGVIEPCYSKAFAGMMEMCDHPDPEIAELFQIKLDMTSSIEMSRALRFRNIAELRCGFGFPYVVSGAHTHRLGGCVVADTKVVVQTVGGCIMQKNIVDVLLSDLVWDGENFCEHEGVAFQGFREVITYDGITGTHDHPCFISETATRGLAELKKQGARIMDCPPPPNWAADASNSRTQER